MGNTMSLETFSSSLLPLKTNAKLAIVTVFLYAVLRRDGTLNRRLAYLCELHAAPNPSPINGVRTADFIIDPVRKLWFRLFLPDNSQEAPLPVMVFFHGGGFAFLSPAQREYDMGCRQFCSELGIAVISVNYRLSPEHRFPAQYDDGVDVLRFLMSTKARPYCCKGILRKFFKSADLSRCFLVGDSAGGNIAHHVARRWTAMDHRHVSLAGLILIQPFFGGEARVPSEMRLLNGPLVTTARTDWIWKAFLPIGATREHVAASPVAASENLAESFPPVLLIGGEFDPLLDWQRIYFRNLIRNGKKAKLIEYPGAIHGFNNLPELNLWPRLIADMRNFLFSCKVCRHSTFLAQHETPAADGVQANSHHHL